MRAGLIGSAALTGAAGSLAAQQPALVPGAHVRVTDRFGRQTDGRVWSVTSDSLQLGLDGHGFVPFAWSDVRSYELARSRARARGAAHGALMGGALGAALILVGLREDAKEGGEVMFPSYVFTVPMTVLLSGIGAGIGTLRAPVRWSPSVSVQQQAASTSSPANTGARRDVWRLGLSARF